MFLAKDNPTLPLLVQIAQIELYFLFWEFNYKILRFLPQIAKITCGIFFKTVDNIGCKTKAFEVKKKVIFTPSKTRSTNFESSWLETFVLYKVEAFSIMLGN
jgi:hypothetical protein